MTYISHIGHNVKWEYTRILQKY